MGWKLQEDGQLHIVYASAYLGDVEEDKLPREKIWGIEDNMGAQSIEQVEVELRKRFKARKIDWALLSEQPSEFWFRSISLYFMDWPQNIARLLFNNFLDYTKEIEKQFLDFTYTGVLEFALELAQAVDKIQEDVERSNTIRVQKELDRARKLYGVT